MKTIINIYFFSNFYFTYLVLFESHSHSPLEPLLGQIQIAKAATYSKRCVKMSTVRNAWFENPEKRCFWKSHTLWKTLYIFFKFSISQEKLWNKSCLKCFKLLFRFFFILMKGGCKTFFGPKQLFLKIHILFCWINSLGLWCIMLKWHIF